MIFEALVKKGVGDVGVGGKESWSPEGGGKLTWSLRDDPGFEPSPESRILLLDLLNIYINTFIIYTFII